MDIQYKTGDLLDGPERFIAHGCNARGVMGSGIALQIKNQHPYAYEAYRRTYELNGNKLDLGSTIWVTCDDKTVINVITQATYGRDPNTVYVDYDALRKGIKQINAHAWVSQNILSFPTSLPRVEEVAFPLIGAGLANGSWATISQIIAEESTNFRPIVYLFDGVMPQS